MPTQRKAAGNLKRSMARTAAGMKTMKAGARHIGPGKAGSGKRMIHKAGGTKKDLRTWRSMPKKDRKAVKASAKRVTKAGGSYDLKKTLKNVRSYRRKKGLRGQTGTGRTTSTSDSSQAAAIETMAKTRKQAASASKRKHAQLPRRSKKGVRSTLAKTAAKVKARHPGMSTKKARRRGRKIIKARNGGKGDT